MKGQVTSITPLGGMQLRQPADPDTAYLLENVTVDNDTIGWSSRVGYERYVPSTGIGFAPFASLGRIDSLYCFRAGVSNSRYSILLESGGTLYLLYEAGGSTAANYTPSLETIRSGRAIPSPNTSGSQYCVIGDQCIVVNGQDRPLVLTLWPLGLFGDVTSSLLAETERTLGWSGQAPSPVLMDVAPIAEATPQTSSTVTNGELSVCWWTANGAYGKSNAYGLGLTAASKTSRYEYAVSFVYGNGSEGPRSESIAVSWSNTSTGKYTYMTGMTIPLGPQGTVARRVYRTVNNSDDSGAPGDRTLYLIEEIRNNVETTYIDYVRDSAAIAPPASSSVPLPAPTARVCSSWDERLWLDGGLVASNRVYWSATNRPDQFGIANYIDLSADGGAVVGLVAYYRMLVVLRENCVDVITRVDAGYQATTVASGVYCRSPRALVVPQLGLLFIAADGVYRMSGGLDGGSTITIEELTEGLDGVMSRWAPDLLPRAVCAYSPITKEAHFYICADGSDRPNLGMVYHVQKKAWSLRSGFPVGDLCTIPSGYLVFGHNEGAEAATQQKPYPQAGLFVISGRRALGGSWNGTLYTEALPPITTYQSAWHSWGSPQNKKQVLYVSLMIAATGDHKITVQVAQDMQPTWTATPTYRLQPPDTDDLPVYDLAVIGTGKWAYGGITTVRYAVAVPMCSWFSFRFQTRDDIVLLGYELTWVATGTQIIEGKV